MTPSHRKTFSKALVNNRNCGDEINIEVLCQINKPFYHSNKKIKSSNDMLLRHYIFICIITKFTTVVYHTLITQQNEILLF